VPLPKAGVLEGPPNWRLALEAGAPPLLSIMSAVQGFSRW
jgi:hypothetical protein